jgi:hypothetical protein
MRQGHACGIHRDRSPPVVFNDIQLEPLYFYLARVLYEDAHNKMNHLTSIANRQRNTRIRDAVFAAFVVFGAIVSITTLSTVAHAASTHAVSR